MCFTQQQINGLMERVEGSGIIRLLVIEGLYRVNWIGMKDYEIFSQRVKREMVLDGLMKRDLLVERKAYLAIFNDSGEYRELLFISKCDSVNLWEEARRNAKERYINAVYWSLEKILCVNDLLGGDIND